jgi:transposase-like protein
VDTAWSNVPKRNSYTDSYKADVVAMVRKGDRNLRQVAHALGLNHWTVRDWCELDATKKKKKSELEVPPSSLVEKPPPVETPEQRLARLELELKHALKENAQLRQDREITKKSCLTFNRSTQHRCASTGGSMGQGYYAYAKRPPSRRAARDRALQVDVRRIHAESRGTYGSPRILRVLDREGHRASKRRVERAMRSQGLAGFSRGGYRVTTKANPTHPKAPNTLDRDLTAERPNERWVTDITYI